MDIRPCCRIDLGNGRFDDRGHRRGDQLRPDQDGSAARSDRTAKYNQLIRIEEQLGDGGIWGKFWNNEG